MLFVVFCVDKPFSTALRSLTRDEHVKFVAGAGEMVRVAGPLMSDDGARMTGSMLIIEAESLEAAHEWQATDPYEKAGLFDLVDIRPWKCTYENGAPRQES